MGATITDPFVGRLVDSRYEVVSRIARGGMATVYLAVDRRLDRDVALKVMHAHLAEGTSGSDFVARFRREARTAARLTHPGLVGVYDQGVDGETSYLTMEYIDGCNLRRHIGERGALTVADALRIGESVLDALAAAHRVGLVHRDIKPENVLLATDGRVKLADFGLARAVTEVTSTTTGTVLGTVAYLAPELVVRGLSDARTDVYASGILLYEMLTGRQPFTGETPIQVAFQHVNNDIPAPSELVDWLPIEIDDAVRALAARDPDDRPIDAAAALALLRRTRAALDDETLARHASVTPSIVLPTATDPAETDLDADDDESDDDDVDASMDDESSLGDDDETTLIETGDARGTTVALPIGLGVGVEVLTAPPADPPRRTPPRPLDRPARPARRAHRRRHVVVPAAGPGRLHDRPDDHRSGRGGGDRDPRARRARRRPLVRVRRRGAGRRGLRDEPGPGRPHPQGRHRRVHDLQGPRLRRHPRRGRRHGAGRRRGRTRRRGAEGHLRRPRVQRHGAERLDHQRDPAGRHTRRTRRPGDQGHRGAAHGLQGSRAGHDHVRRRDDARGRHRASCEPDNLTLAPTEVFSDTVAAGLIIDQSPVAGAEGHRGDTIAVNVSKGPEMLALPSTYGQNVKTAEAALQAAGFIVKVEHPQGISPLNIVYSQKPEGGEGKTAPRGSTIVINVF